MTQVTRLGRAGSVTLSKGLGHDQTEVDNGGDVDPPVDQVPVTGAAIETKVGAVALSGLPTKVQENYEQNELGSISVVLPAPVSAGSLLIAWMDKRSDTDLVAPTGWALIDSIVSASTHGGAGWWKIADGTEGDTFAFTGGPGTHRKNLYIAEWTGVNVLDVSDSLTAQPLATTQTLPSVTPTSGVNGVVFGMFVKNAQASAYTPGSGYTEDFDQNVGAAEQPRGMVEHLIVSPFAGSSYAPDSTQPTSRNWGGVVAVFVGDASEVTWEPAPEVGDTDDTSYHETDQDEYNLRADLGTSLLIDHVTLLLSTLAAGTRTLYLYGSNDPDFDTQSLLASASFVSAGSHDPETLDFSWSATTAYRYYRFRVSDADTYRYYTLSMYLPQESTGSGCCDTSKYIPDSGSAVTLDFTVANWWYVTLTDDCSVSVVGAPDPPDVAELHAVWIQGPGGPYTITYGSEVLIPDTDGTDGGTPPTLHTTETAQDVHVLTSADGATWGLSYDSAGTGGNANDTSLVEVTSSGSAQTVDVSVARTYDITLDDDCAIDFDGAVDDEAWFASVIVRQGIGAPYLVTWDAAVTWQGGTAPILSTTTGDWDVVTLLTVDGGVNWLGVAGDSSVTAHIADTTDAHDASAISIQDTGGYYSSADVEGALAEIGAGGIGVGAGGEDTSLVIEATSGASYTLDCTTARRYDLQLTNNCVISFAAVGSLESHEIRLVLRQDGTGSRTVTWPASVKWVGGSAPTLATSTYDVNLIRLITTSAGSEWYGISEGAIALTAYPFASAGGGTFPLVWLNPNI